MPPIAPLAVTWSPRRVPLEPHAAFAQGAAAVRLGRRLLELDDDRLEQLVAVAAPSALLVIGPPRALVWVDGVVYLGRAASAPKLLVPTNLEPSAPIDLLQRALLADLQAAAPVAVIVDPPRLISAGDARSIDRGRLSRWLAP